MNHNSNNHSITIKLSENMTSQNKKVQNNKVKDDHNTSKSEQTPPPHNTSSTKILTRSMTAQQLAEQQQQQSRTKIMYFADLQARVLPIINEWAQTPEAKEHEFYQDWKTKWKDKITMEHGFSLLKKTLGFHTMEDYHDMLLQCPAIPTKLHLQYNADEKKIYFTERTVAPTNSFTTETQTMEPTPKETESNPPIADLTDMPLPPRKTYHTSIEEYSFALFQHTVIPIIRTWASTTEASHHHFFLT
jgi:hypothetical protein